MPKWVYDFDEGSKDMRELLGGKGANVAEMTRVLGPERVPAGFTITTEACVAYMRAERREPEAMSEQVARARASGSVTRAIRCSCPCVPERGSRCRACSIRC